MAKESLASVKAERDALRELVAAAASVKPNPVVNLLPDGFLKKWKHDRYFTVMLGDSLRLNVKGEWEYHPGRNSRDFSNFLLRTSFVTGGEALDAAAKAFGRELHDAKWLRELYRDKE